MATSFPVVLVLLQQLLQSNTSAASAVALVGFKVFWSTMQIVLPPHLLEPHVLDSWLDLLINTLEQPLPEDAPTELEGAMAWRAAM